MLPGGGRSGGTCSSPLPLGGFPAPGCGSVSPRAASPLSATPLAQALAGGSSCFGREDGRQKSPDLKTGREGQGGKETKSQGV